MKLAELIRNRPDLFYRQEWYEGEPFMEADRVGRLVMPDDVTSYPPEQVGYLPHAVTLALLYVGAPADSLWRRWLWTADKDRHGNRVYVGGVGQFDIPTFQIHRALDYNRMCEVAVWSS